jgi:hypothetical protein
MVEYEDMTPEERDRLIYLVLNEEALKAIVLIMKKKYGPDVTTDQVMRFAFKVARNRMIPAHLKKKKPADKNEMDETQAH